MPEPTDGAKLTMIDQGLIGRLTGKFREWIVGPRAEPRARGSEPAILIPEPNRNLPAPPNAWMGPGSPLMPFAPVQDVVGRRYDYPAAYNIGTQPRQYEGVSFAVLRNLADALDLARLCVETRKDQMAKLTFTVQPKMAPQQKVRSKGDARCQEIQDFFRKPDRKTPWDGWMRQAMEEVLVTDALSIYVRRTMDGRPYAVELVDGATIRPLIDEYGRTPVAPAPAYQQIMKGVPVISYTTDELIYMPRNQRVNKIYGFSPIEQIVMTVNIAIRREVSKLEIYTQGNIPDAFASVPKEWNPQQIEQFQTYWDSMTSDQRSRRRMKFVPGDMRFQPTRDAQIMMDPADEWLARMISFAFSLPPLPFVRQTNRATAQTAKDQAMEEGLMPMMTWFKGVIDHIIQVTFSYDDLEIVWDDARSVDPAEMENRNLTLVRAGVKSIDDMRAEMGKEPLGLGPMIWGLGPLGVISVEALKKAIAQGLDMPQGPMVPDAFGGMPGMGAPGMGAPGIGAPGMAGPSNGLLHPGAADALRGIPQKLLDAVGLGGVVDSTDAASAQDDPEALIAMAAQPPVVGPRLRRNIAGSNVVAHPAVLRTLHQAESRLGRQA